MSDQQELQQPTEASADTLGQSIFRSAWGLSLFAIFTAGLIALTQVLTKDTIEDQIKQARSKALLEIVPLGEFDNDLLDDAFWLDAEKSLGLKEPSEAFVALADGQPKFFILPLVAPDGYTGPIKLIMSVDIAGKVMGLRVIEHKETPGLGDKIEIRKSDWVRSFEGRSLENTSEQSWAVKKDGGEFDQMTGATITPRSIVAAVYRGLLFYRDHQTELLTKAGFPQTAALPETQMTGEQP